MDCVQSANNGHKLLKCRNFLFIDTESNYEDSIKLCKVFNHELAVVDIKSGRVSGNSLKRLTKKIKKQLPSFSDGLYGIGLKFQRVNETFEGNWVNRKKFNVQNNKKVKHYLNLLEFDCIRVLVDVTSQSLELDSCNNSYQPLCTELSEGSTQITTINTTNTPKTNTSVKNISQTDNMVQNKSEFGCNISTNILLTSLSLLAVMLIFLTIVYSYKKCFEKNQKQETDTNNIKPSKSNLKKEDIKKVENDIYVEAEPVKMYRIEYNKSIMNEKEQSDKQYNKKLRPPSNYVDL